MPVSTKQIPFVEHNRLSILAAIILSMFVAFLTGLRNRKAMTDAFAMLIGDAPPGTVRPVTMIDTISSG